MAKKSKGTGSGKKTSLPKFFRDLHKNPEKLEQFSAGPEQRAAIIDGSNLSDDHKDVLKKGCVPDIIRAFSGLPLISSPVASAWTTVDCCDEIGCKHPHCNAFAAAASIPVAKAATIPVAKAAPKKPASKKAPPKKKR
jgi:hypothetical protein